MTMHLAQGLTTLNTRKRKTKQVDRSVYEAEMHAHNKQSRRDGLPQLQFATLDQYITYRTGSGHKVGKEFKPMVIKTVAERYIRQTPVYKSKGGTTGDAVKVLSKAYTGDYMIGIATMHKSNLVPVTRDGNPSEYSTMRRS
jgi:hypothetical protein